MSDQEVQTLSVREVSRFDRWHDFWQVATPNIFSWFQWAAVLGLLSYIDKKSPSFWLTLLVVLGYLALIFYFGGFFVRRSIPIPWIRSKIIQRMVWQVIAILLGCGADLLIQYAVAALSNGTS